MGCSDSKYSATTTATDQLPTSGARVTSSNDPNSMVVDAAFARDRQLAAQGTSDHGNAAVDYEAMFPTLDKDLLWTLVAEARTPQQAVETLLQLSAESDANRSTDEGSQEPKPSVVVHSCDEDAATEEPLELEPSDCGVRLTTAEPFFVPEPNIEEQTPHPHLLHRAYLAEPNIKEKAPHPNPSAIYPISASFIPAMEPFDTEVKAMSPNRLAPNSARNGFFDVFHCCGSL